MQSPVSLLNCGICSPDKTTCLQLCALLYSLLLAIVHSYSITGLRNLIEHVLYTVQVGLPSHHLVLFMQACNALVRWVQKLQAMVPMLTDCVKLFSNSCSRSHEAAPVFAANQRRDKGQMLPLSPLHSTLLPLLCKQSPMRGFPRCQLVSLQELDIKSMRVCRTVLLMFDFCMLCTNTCACTHMHSQLHS